MAILFGSPEAAAILQSDKCNNPPSNFDDDDDETEIIEVKNPNNIDQLEKRLKVIDDEKDDLSGQIAELEDELYAYCDEERAIKARIKKLKANPAEPVDRKLTQSDLAAYNMWLATGESSIWVPAEHQAIVLQPQKLWGHYAHP